MRAVGQSDELVALGHVQGGPSVAVDAEAESLQAGGVVDPVPGHGHALARVTVPPLGDVTVRNGAVVSTVKLTEATAMLFGVVDGPDLDDVNAVGEADEQVADRSVDRRTIRRYPGGTGSPAVPEFRSLPVQLTLIEVTLE